jgi:predicted nucleic acid-binding protein
LHLHARENVRITCHTQRAPKRKPNNILFLLYILCCVRRLPTVNPPRPQQKSPRILLLIRRGRVVFFFENFEPPPQYSAGIHPRQAAPTTGFFRLVILDTSALSELTRISPEPTVVAWLDRPVEDEVYITAISKAEALFGVECMPAGKRKFVLEESYRTLFNERLYGRILSFDDGCASHFARLAATAFAPGKGFSTICRSRRLRNSIDSGLQRGISTGLTMRGLRWLILGWGEGWGVFCALSPKLSPKYRNTWSLRKPTTTR